MLAKKFRYSKKCQNFLLGQLQFYIFTEIVFRVSCTLSRKYLSHIPDLHIVRLPIIDGVKNNITVVVVLTSVTNNYYSGSLPSSDRVNLNYVYDPDLTLTGAELTISGVVIADSGTYECRATNKHGSVTKQVRIDVQAGTTPGVVSG